MAYDVVVAGGGNAGMCAAHAAREAGANVLVIEKAPQAWSGGNSYFTAGAIRTIYDGLDDVLPYIDGVSDEQLGSTDLPAYTREEFLGDMHRLTEGLCDPELTSILVNDAADIVRWLHQLGIRFRLMYDRQSFKVNGRHRFWGGLAVGTIDGGAGLMKGHLAAAERAGIPIRYECPLVDLVRGANGGVAGVIVAGPHGYETIETGAIVLATGGFEADPRMRAAYLGPNWDVARVRGTPYNTGDGLQLALAWGAQPYGHWSGCHSIAWDAAAPRHGGDLSLTNLLSKQSYPLGIVVNRAGRRFLDEGADFRNYTYAKYGAEILKQPGAIAWQLFDAQTTPLLRHDEYTAAGVSRIEADTMLELAEQAGISPTGLSTTVAEFNAAISSAPFDPAIKDGKCTTGITPPKSNWAVPLEAPPFVAFAVTCGITFTFGGVRISPDGTVLDRTGSPIPGLHAAGELVGGLFYHNYPGGSGLTSGAVFGRRAGRAAAQYAASLHH